jgi:hypothetical protein
MNDDDISEYDPAEPPPLFGGIVAMVESSISFKIAVS